MNSTFRALAVAAVVLAAGVLGYFVFSQTDLPGGGPAATTGGGSSPAQQTAAPAPADDAVPFFAFRRLEIDTSRDAAEACLFFSRALDGESKVRYEDYVKLDPEVAVSLRVVENRLCIAGLAFEQTYQATLRAGLPAANGEKLQADEVVPVALRDREPLIAFGSGLILPRENADGVPVSSVNVQALKIKLLRVSDRLVSQLQSGLIDQRVLYGYDEEQLQENQASLVWEGEMAVAARKNQTVTTVFPIAKAIQSAKPGVYIVLARDAAEDESTAQDIYWRGVASQWVINSDVGLTSFSGAHGLTVFARSLKSAQPLPGVEVALVSRGNVELARVTTDGSGKASFDAGLIRGTGADEAVMALAYAGQDFTFLDLRRPAFDLSDRGVAGRATPGPVDGFLYTERGIYRPGETVRLTALLRDGVARAAPQAPLTVVVTRPDGLEWRRFTLNEQQAGGASLDVMLTDTAARGQWEAAAYLDPKGQPVGRVSFDVQDFVPQRLKVTLSVPEGVLRAGEEVAIPVEGRFLYGAPAAGVSGEGDIAVVADPDPFPALEGYSFGRVDEKFEEIKIALSVAAADAAGKTQAVAALGALPETSLPLVGRIRVALYEPGGRMTTETASMPVRTRDLMIGIRPDFEDGVVQENTEARFEIVAVDALGKPLDAAGLTYALVREEYDYQWYQDEAGQWRYETIVRDRVLSQGALQAKADAPAKFGQVVDWGSYRLTVSDASGASSSVRFYAGWGAQASGDRPDRVAVAAPKETFAAGETAKIDIRPPSDGQALIVVASDRVLETRLIDAPASGASVEIPVSADWGAGAYVLVTHYRALDSAQSRAPVRAIGVAWLGVDQAGRTLGVTFGAPDKVAPRQAIEVPVTVANANGEDAYVTVAAVDEGILQLTDYATPDPAAHYFGKRRLGVDMRDDYGRLIESTRAMVGELRSGGDSLGGRSLALVPQRTVALFSGVVKTDAQGRATVKLDIPDFNGELRLMAAAWTPTRVGKGERPLTVRDAVVADLTLPRFLAPGDEAVAALNLHNVEGGAGEYTAVVTATGAVAPQSGDAVTVSANLPVTQRTLLAIPLRGAEPGIGTIALKVTGPNGFAVERSWGIEVRPPMLPQADEIVAVQKPGESFALPKDLLAAYVPGTTSVAVTLTGARGFDNVAGMLRWLDRYPFGCLEQTTSRAFPLVHFNDMALLAGAKQDLTIPARVQQAIDRVADMQMYSGAFGMWSSGSSEADAWLSVYATDFLTVAKGKGYVVPQDAVTRALGWLRTTAGADWHADHTRAYAFYVLARQGAVNPGEVRYFADNRISGMTNPLAVGLTGAALSAIGDRARSGAAFARVRDMVAAAEPSSYVAPDYGSYLRDIAGLTFAAAEGQDMVALPALLERAAQVPMKPEWTTTQEKGWMLLAANAIRAQAPAISADVRGVEGAAVKDNALRFSPTPAEVAAGVTVGNTGQRDVWRIVSVEGVPAQVLPAASSGGLALKRTFWTLDGQPADLAALRQNDQIVVKIEGGLDNNYYRDMAILDLLPAGLEIEAGVTPDQASALYPWLGPLTGVAAQQLRDDRYVATFGIGSRYRPSDGTPEPQPVFAVAYVARAVTPGVFVLPPANAEDMYAPGVRARTDGGKVAIAAAQ